MVIEFLRSLVRIRLVGSTFWQKKSKGIKGKEKKSKKKESRERVVQQDEQDRKQQVAERGQVTGITDRWASLSLSHSLSHSISQYQRVSLSLYSMGIGISR